MNISQGDVILRRGEFAFVWDAPASNRIRIFPIKDAMDGFNPHDLVVQNWREMDMIARISPAVICITKARFVDPLGWVKMPDLAFTLPDILSVYRSIYRMVDDCGFQSEWPYVGSSAERQAPILAS